MQKLGIRLLIFGCIVFITLEIGSRFDNIDRQYNNNPNIVRAVIAKRFDSLDILFVGSSATYSGINPLYFDSVGLRTFNVSVAAAGPFFYEVLINDYLRSVTKKPRSVFIQLSPATFIDDIDDFSSFGIHRYLNYPLSNEKIVQKYGQWTSYISLLLKSFQKGIKNLIYIDKSTTPIARQTIQFKGFYPSDDITSAVAEASQMKGRKWRSQHFDTARSNYLMRYINSLKKQGITVVLLTVPMNKLGDSFNTQFMNEYRHVLATVSAGNLLFDKNQMPLDSIAYRDIDHLNTKGASIVSKAVIADIFNDQSLRALYNLRDTVKTNQP
jgi:hypothetical protein